MALSYHFVNLDDEQTARRRHLLNWYGQFAQLSIFLIPLIYYLLSGIRLLLSRLDWLKSSRTGKDHRSPVVSRFEEPSTGSSRTVWARLRWALDDELVEGWGTWRQWVFAGSWTAWMFLLAVKDTGDDYLHLTKRFGIIAASQLPLHYALALKDWSPIQYLTRMSHEELNPYHRLLGQIILVFFSLHASMYLNFYIQKGLLLKRIRDWDVILGLMAITTAILLGTAALSRIRTWNYRLFFYSHVILSISLLPTLYFHVTHLRAYILEASAIYMLLILQRNVSQSATNATIKQLPNTNLLSITIPFDNNALSTRVFRPGQHIYLGFPSLPQKLRINPFSIANPSPHIDHKIQLVARTLTGTTAILADLADEDKSPAHTVPLLIEGPYGSAAYFPNFTADFDHVLLVAGGVGATFTLPIYIDLVKRRKRNESPKVRFVWVVRQEADARWGLEMLWEHMGGEALAEEMVELYVTGFGSATMQNQSRTKDNDDESIELQECQHLIHPNDEPVTTILNASNPPPISINPSRPDLPALVDAIFTKSPTSASQNKKVAILVCGPKAMGNSLRREVGKWVAKGREVWWHNEEFAW